MIVDTRLLFLARRRGDSVLVETALTETEDIVKTRERGDRDQDGQKKKNHNKTEDIVNVIAIQVCINGAATFFFF